MLEIKELNFSDNFLKTLWEKMEEKNSFSIFQSFSWNKNWYERIGSKDSNLKIIIKVAFIDNLPVAIFPLILKKRYFNTIIEFFGEDQFDYKTPIFDKNINIYEVWQKISESLPKHDVKYLDKIPSHIGGLTNPFSLLNFSKSVQESFQIDLPNRVENINFISKSSKSQTLRRRRRLSERGDLKFSVCNSLEEYKKVIPETLKQKEHRYLETGVRNILADYDVKKFYESLYLSDFRKIKIHLSYLSLNEKILATHLGYIYDDTFYWIFPSFKRSNFDKYSPGRILLYELIIQSIESGLKKFDFTVGSEDFKKKWSNNNTKLITYYHYNSFRGFLFCKILKVINYLKSHPQLRPFLMNINKKIRLIK